MVQIKNIRETKKGENVWAIVRSLKSPGTMKQVADLSPSKYLFWKYLDWKKAGKWNHDTFETMYVTTFLRELRANPAAIDLLRQLARMPADEDVTLVCFCDDETLCHRSIIAGILQGAGANIALKSGADYSRYYSMFGVDLS